MDKLKKKRIEKRMRELQKKIERMDCYIPSFRKNISELKSRIGETNYFLNSQQFADCINQSGYQCSLNELPHISRLLYMYEAWRHSKGCYFFDDPFISSLINTEIDSIPSEIFNNFPEWCVYIDLDFLNTDGMPQQYGFFATPVFCGKTNRYTAILLSFEYKEFNNDLKIIKTGFDDLVVDLSSGVVNIDEIIKSHDDIVSPHSPATMKLEVLKKEKPFEYIGNNKKQMEKLRKRLSDCLNMLVYLCSQEQDITKNDEKFTPRKPRIKQNHKKQQEIKTREDFNYLTVGKKIGLQLKLCSVQSGHGIKMKPHIRRAHWHKYWTGSKKEELTHERKLILKWIPPVMINTKSLDELPINIKS